MLALDVVQSITRSSPGVNQQVALENAWRVDRRVVFEVAKGPGGSPGVAKVIALDTGKEWPLDGLGEGRLVQS